MPYTMAWNKKHLRIFETEEILAKILALNSECYIKPLNRICMPLDPLNQNPGVFSVNFASPICNINLQ